MPRRKSNRGRPRIDTARPQGLGAHWRADGAPKNGYRTQRDALTVAAEREESSGVALNVYRCDLCSAWHLGNAAGREP